MNIRLRRTYFAITVILFFIIAPLILFYAAGWRYNQQTSKLEKVGAVVIDTEPRNASVFLNGKLLKKNTPIIINNLLANDYLITIQKENFFNWSQNITVKQSRTTRLPTIYLLKTQSDIKPIITTPIIKNTLSPDKNKLIILKSSELEIIDLNDQKKLFSMPINSQVSSLQWSSDSNKFIIASENGNFQLIDLTSSEDILNINISFNISPDSVQWSQDESEILYAYSNNVLYRLNIFQKTKAKILNKQGILYVIDKLYLNHKLPSLDVINSNGEIINTLQLSENAKLEFLPLLQNFLPILDKTNQIAYFYNIKDNSFEQLDDEVKQIYWHENSDILLFINDHEIWSWNRKNSIKELIVRTSEVINDAKWLLNEHYVIYSQLNNEVKIIEAQGPQKNIYAIPLNNAEQIFVNDDKVYLIADQQLYLLNFQ